MFRQTHFFHETQIFVRKGWKKNHFGQPQDFLHAIWEKIQITSVCQGTRYISLVHFANTDYNRVVTWFIPLISYNTLPLISSTINVFISSSLKHRHHILGVRLQPVLGNSLRTDFIAWNKWPVAKCTAEINRERIQSFISFLHLKASLYVSLQPTGAITLWRTSILNLYPSQRHPKNVH